MKVDNERNKLDKNSSIFYIIYLSNVYCIVFQQPVKAYLKEGLDTNPQSRYVTKLVNKQVSKE